MLPLPHSSTSASLNPSPLLYPLPRPTPSFSLSTFSPFPHPSYLLPSPTILISIPLPHSNVSFHSAFLHSFPPIHLFTFLLSPTPLNPPPTLSTDFPIYFPIRSSLYLSFFATSISNLSSCPSLTRSHPLYPALLRPSSQPLFRTHALLFDPPPTKPGGGTPNASSYSQRPVEYGDRRDDGTVSPATTYCAAEGIVSSPCTLSTAGTPECTPGDASKG